MRVFRHYGTLLNFPIGKRHVLGMNEDSFIAGSRLLHFQILKIYECHIASSVAGQPNLN
jgi:hypothetical protein